MDGWGEVSHWSFSLFTHKMVLHEIYHPFTKRFYHGPLTREHHLWGTYIQQVQRLQLPPSERHGLPPRLTGIGTVLFDTQQDLLWIGTDSVSLAYYHRPFTSL